MATATFEQLPDEVLLMVYQFLPQYDVICAFSKLNSRLECTIAHFYRSLTVYRKNYEVGVQTRKLLQMIGPYLETLTVKNTDVTSKQLSCAANIHELTLIRTTVQPFPTLSNLTDLNIIDCENTFINEVLFNDAIHLHSVYVSSTSPLLILPESQNKICTVKQLAVTVLSHEDFVGVLRLCPQLTCLNIYRKVYNFEVTQPAENPTPPEQPSELRTFSLRTPYDISVTFNNLKYLFQHLPSSLERLGVEIITADLSCLDGQVWEDYLKETFPDLVRVEFFISYRIHPAADRSRIRLAPIQQTFQSLYWSKIMPQDIAGDYSDSYGSSVNIFTQPIPTVRRRRYFID